jgi:hypothetical protein
MPQPFAALFRAATGNNHPQKGPRPFRGADARRSIQSFHDYLCFNGAARSESSRYEWHVASLLLSRSSFTSFQVAFNEERVHIQPACKPRRIHQGITTMPLG